MDIQNDAEVPGKFHGKPCRKCNSTLRYTNKGQRCVKCLERYYQENRDRIRENHRRYHQENQERDNERNRRNRRKDPEKRSRQSKEYYQRNRDRIRLKERERRQNNLEAERLRLRLYYRTERGKQMTYIRCRRRRALKRQTLTHPYTPQELQSRFALFDNACAYCGCRENLTVDHYKAIAKGGHDLLWFLVPACERCNKSKRDNDLMEWYLKQDFFCPHRFRRLLEHLPLD